MFKKIYWILDKIRSMVIIGMLGYIVILSFVQIVLRAFTSADLKPFAWGDEIIRLMAVWVAFLAASVGVKQESHLSVQFFLDRFLTPAQLRIVKKCAIFVVMAALASVTYAGTMHVMKNTTNMLQNLPGVTIAWFYASIPVGCSYLMLEYGILLFAREDKEKHTEKEGVVGK